jgi:hypothetical protein
MRAEAVCSSIMRLSPNEAHFRACVDSLSRDAAGARPALELASLTAPGGQTEFLSATARVRRQREQLACAMAGLDEGTPAYQACVADLAAAMFALDNPQN